MRMSLIDFAHRAIHETTVAAKTTVDGFYGNAPKLSYFNGCSTGGRQAVTAAQRYPEDFDGIVGWRACEPHVHAGLRSDLVLLRRSPIRRPRFRARS